MAKKSVRLLSLLLAALMLVTMIPVVASAAESSDTELVADKDHLEIDYAKLVGEENQAKSPYPVYVVNENWAPFTKGGKQYVTFNFRGKAVTEVYDETRHLASVDKVYNQSKIDGVAVPYCILTEGNYSTQITLSSSIYLLGAKAGMNPTVESAPNVEWKMSNDRKLPDITSADTQGETRIWAGIELAKSDFEAMNSAYSDMNLRLVTCNTTSGDNNYVFDGIVFQGYGAVVADDNTGTGNRTYYFQNVIFNNGYSYDCDQIRMWCRTNSAYTIKRLNIYNSYATGMKNLGLYSGHASAIQVNGLCWQNNYAGVFYKAQTLQWQGFNFEMKNSHFWNSETIASTETPRNANRNDRILYIDFTAPALNTDFAGTNKEAFHYSVTNNSFWNMNSVSSYYNEYTLQNTSPLFFTAMAGTDEKFVMENNVFGSSFNMADNLETKNSRNPLQIVYLKNQTTGEITHAGNEAPTLITETDAYALTSKMVQVNNNIYVGEMYQNTVPNIGNNTHPDTLVEMTGNYYTADLNSGVGTYTVGSIEDNIYDKWVYLSNLGDDLDNAKNRSDYINENAFSFSVEGATLKTVGDKSYTIDTDATSLTVKHTAGPDDTYTNYAEVYGADSNFQKLYVETDSATESTIEFNNQTSYFVVSLLSCDKRTSVDHLITINRPVDKTTALRGIIPDDKTQLIKENNNNFVYEVNYTASKFKFTANLPENITSEIVDKNGKTINSEKENGKITNGFTVDLPEYDTPYEFKLNVGKNDLIFNKATYTLTFIRRKSSEANVVELTYNNGTPATINTDAKTVSITVPTSQKSVEFVPAVSADASYKVVDVAFNKTMTAAGGKYTATELAAGENEFEIRVTAHDGTVKTWKLVITRPADTNTNLKSVNNATKTANGYVANVTSSKFIIVPVAESASSEVQIFADEACTDKITDPAITLTAKSINVWLRVVAESGAKSAPIKLTINTTTTGTETDSGKKPMVDNGIIGVTGAEPFTTADTTIVVNLGKDPKDYNFKAIGLAGYSVSIYGDAKHTLWAPTEATITPDTGVSYLYAVAKKGNTVYNYTIKINAYISVDFKDSAKDWAKAYVAKLETAGAGLMKGDEKGNFNGDDNLNRYEMAIMMVRLTGANKDLYKDVKLPFRDSIVDWASNYVKAAYRIGLIGGHAILDEDGNVEAYEYKGFDNATRSEYAKVFMNAIFGGDITNLYKANKQAIDKLVADKKFSDVTDVDDWAVPYVYFAISEGVIKGEGNRINPDGNVTRYEAAAMLCRRYFGMA